VSGMNGGSLGALATFEPGFLGQKCGFGASAAAKGTAIRVRNLHFTLTPNPHPSTEKIPDTFMCPLC